MTDKLTTIFDLLCDDFKNLLERDEPMSAQERKLLLEFLRDNGISVVGMNNDKIKSIVDTLPFSEEEQTNTSIN